MRECTRVSRSERRRLPVDSTASQLEATLKKEGPVDLFTLDGQHRPLQEDLVKFCKLAARLGVGVQLRIPHQRLAFMTGRYADLGVLAILVPLVEAVGFGVAAEDRDES